MAVICPTVTAFDTHEYRAQMELLEPFAERIHIDLMDGDLAPTRSPALEQIWLSEKMVNDVHLMYRRPGPYLEQLIRLRPSLVIIHAEAEADHADFAAHLQAAGIKAGLGVLQKTTVDDIEPLLGHFDHVMIFSGNLGYHGGSAVDLSLLDKVSAIRERHPKIEIAWDGGVTDQNARHLADNGADVLNVGGFIHKAPSPQEAYAKLKAIVKNS